jgi:hypothetical protein
LSWYSLPASRLAVDQDQYVTQFQIALQMKSSVFPIFTTVAHDAPARRIMFHRPMEKAPERESIDS